MRNLFSYDSKLTQMLGYVLDLFVLNVIFLICCLPIFTIGAAQAGLYTATRQMIDPEDDRSVIKAYFRGFASGFGKITLIGTFFMVLEFMLLFTLFSILENLDTGLYMKNWIFPAIMLGLCMLIHSLIPVFHSRFNCRPFHLFRNSVLLLVAAPLRSLAVMILTWAPIGVYYLGWYMGSARMHYNLIILVVTIYYSVAFLFGAFLMEKPFKLLIDDIEDAEDKDE